jgi:hypothetical protein
MNMRYTYRTLAALINLMSDEQKDCDVTVENPFEEECYAAHLRIAGTQHDSLDENHPVIYINTNDDCERRDDVQKIAGEIDII